ncbi:D-amino-acid transaminase [Desulfogranum marinum]|uniref:D-amino-acid transaminase n=1 Tax=Desulfogranum marinum TaxID=453220 RepID=UPI001964170C|nr:D-amino-acid transaminase [Desulfogranum marinum]MBM9514276.1 D-amino-acid transaminase [Desulfogranum marinum]
MKGIVFINDTFVPVREAKVSAFDRGFLFGDGVYEVVPVVNSRIVNKMPFLQRLDHSLRAVDIEWPFSKEKYVAILEDLIRRNDLKEGGIYTQVTRGVAPRDFAYPIDTPPTCMAFTIAKDFVNTPLAKNGVSVVTVEDIRWKRRDIKSIALLGQCMAKQEAYENGAYEGWMVEDGFVTEGTTSTAYIIKNNKIITRPLSRSILPGIRRKCLLQLAKTHNIAIEERLFTVAEALDADEALLSSATSLVLPVVKIDGYVIGNGKPGEMTEKLRSLYVQMVQKESGSEPATEFKS